MHQMCWLSLTKPPKGSEHVTCLLAVPPVNGWDRYVEAKEWPQRIPSRGVPPA